MGSHIASNFKYFTMVRSNTKCDAGLFEIYRD